MSAGALRHAAGGAGGEGGGGGCPPGAGGGGGNVHDSSTHSVHGAPLGMNFLQHAAQTGGAHLPAAFGLQLSGGGGGEGGGGLGGDGGRGGGLGGGGEGGGGRGPAHCFLKHASHAPPSAR